MAETASKPEAVAPISFTSFNLCEEYANAFRTESYNEFWSRVLNLNFTKAAPSDLRSLARLPSDGFLVESLLDPNEAAVSRVLMAHVLTADVENHSLLVDFFSETANASHLCGLLLKNVERARLLYGVLKANLDDVLISNRVEDSWHLIEHLAFAVEGPNPFNSLGPTQHAFKTVRADSAALLVRLESGRRKARAKLRFATRLRRMVAVFLVTLTASTSVVGVYVALHTLVALVALPALLPGWFRFVSTRWLGRAVARLDAATKGVYILSRELDTISRLVERLRDELEHLLSIVRLCSKRRGREEGLSSMKEVVRQLQKNETSFNEQLDELEEHLFLCFLTINKARSLVVNEILM